MSVISYMCIIYTATVELISLNGNSLKTLNKKHILLESINILNMYIHTFY